MELMSKTHHRVYKNNGNVVKVGMSDWWSPESEAYLFNYFNRKGELHKAVVKNGDLVMPYVGFPIDRDKFDYIKAMDYLVRMHSDTGAIDNDVLVFEHISFYEDLKNRVDRRVDKGGEYYSELMSMVEKYAGKWEKLDTAPQCLIHGDIHEGNWVYSPSVDNYYLIDWETYQLAPVELEYATWFFFKEFYGSSFNEKELDDFLFRFFRPLDKELLNICIVFKMIGSLSFIYRRCKKSGDWLEYEDKKSITENFIIQHF